MAKFAPSVTGVGRFEKGSVRLHLGPSTAKNRDSDNASTYRRLKRYVYVSQNFHRTHDDHSSSSWLGLRESGVQTTGQNMLHARR
jgi:hypothetical protein